MELLVLDGWNPGLNKVALTKLLQSRAGIPLAAAKHHVDELLSGRTVRLPLSGQRDPGAVVQQAQKLGAIAHLGTDSRVPS